MKIAIFGGSFDPPHNGHVAIIEQVLASLNIDVLIVLVAYQNPLKAHYRIQAQKRFIWMQTICKDYKKVICSDYEILQNKLTTTIESIGHFKQLYNPSTLYFVLGQDNFLQVPQWHDFELLKRNLFFVVFGRETKDSLNTDGSGQDVCEKFAQEYGLRMQYMHFSYCYASSVIVKNLSGYKDEIPNSIRHDVMESYNFISGKLIK